MENNVEIWKDIIGFEGIYQISNYGNVKSCKRYVNTEFGERVVNEKLLKLGKNRGGYLIVRLYKYGIKKTFKPHRLVANAFIENPENKNQVNHKNHIKTDNSMNNLEWVSNLENTCHSQLKKKRTSDFIGVSMHGKNRWQSSININGKRTHLGSFATEQEAYEARKKFEKDNGIENKYI